MGMSTINFWHVFGWLIDWFKRGGFEMMGRVVTTRKGETVLNNEGILIGCLCLFLAFVFTGNCDKSFNCLIH